MAQSCALGATATMQFKQGQPVLNELEWIYWIDSISQLIISVRRRRKTSTRRRSRIPCVVVEKNTTRRREDGGVVVENFF